jgi:hypothetical protein
VRAYAYWRKGGMISAVPGQVVFMASPRTCCDMWERAGHNRVFSRRRQIS